MRSIIEPRVAALDLYYATIAGGLKNALIISLASTDDKRMPSFRYLKDLVSDVEKSGVRDIRGGTSWATSFVRDYAVREAVKLSTEESYKSAVLKVAGETREAVYRDIFQATLSRLRLDAAFIERRFRQFKIDVAKSMVTDGLSIRDAIRSEKIRALDFNFSERDVAGRRWSTFRQMHIKYKSGLVSIFNDTQVFALKLLGHENAYIWNPGGASHQTEFSLQEYESLGETLFHPNTYGIVVPKVTG